MTSSTESYGIRGAFFDFITNPWELSAQGVDESESARFISDGLLVINSGCIQDFGTFEDLYPKYRTLEVRDYQDRLILPGFIDAHTHFPQQRIIGGYGETLLEWLQKYIYPEEANYFNLEYAKEGAEQFINATLASGTTTFQAFTTTHPHTTTALFEEAQRRNMRIITGLTGHDINAPDYYKDTPESFYIESKKLIEKYHNKKRLLYAITPRFALGSSREQLLKCQQLKKEYPDCWLNTHLSETVTECQCVLNQFSECKDYLSVYEQFGLVGPKFSGGHSIWLSESEFQRLHDLGGSAVFCASSNLWLGSGLFQLAKATDPKRPILISVGSDIGGGNTFNLLRVLNDSYKVGMLSINQEQIKNGSLSQEWIERSKLSPYRAFYLATLGGARALRLDKWLGNFTPGKEADFTVLNYHSGPEEISGVLKDIKSKSGEAIKTMKECISILWMTLTLNDSRVIDETWVFGKRAYKGRV